MSRTSRLVQQPYEFFEANFTRHIRVDVPQQGSSCKSGNERKAQRCHNRQTPQSARHSHCTFRWIPAHFRQDRCKLLGVDFTGAIGVKQRENAAKGLQLSFSHGWLLFKSRTPHNSREIRVSSYNQAVFDQCSADGIPRFNTRRENGPSWRGSVSKGSVRLHGYDHRVSFDGSPWDKTSRFEFC
jgi:hypothetical protein